VATEPKEEVAPEPKEEVVSKPREEVPSATIPEERLEVLKGIISDLHNGEDLNVLKKRFAELVRDVSPVEISQMEQKLIEQGMPESEVKRLCDVHVEVFKHSLEEQEIPKPPKGHPVHTLMEENRASERIMASIKTLLDKIGTPPDRKIFLNNKKKLKNLIRKLSRIDKHYLKKENQLFPMLEAHEITGPTQVMWAIHDDIRAAIKAVKAQISQDISSVTINSIRDMVKMIEDMIYKEEHILYPTSLEALSDDEWIKVKEGEEEIGYAWIEPFHVWPTDSEVIEDISEIEEEEEGKLSLDTGNLTLDQINLMLTHLPVDITLVDENDRVAYYSSGKERIFPRSPGVIGREVQKCHPPNSVHVVTKILDEFKAGTKDVAEFWIRVKGRLIYIRYFAVRNADGKYKGTLEVSQDVTDLKKLEGERRLLDWK
jgi:PAS domain S-box-containing protein